MFTYRFVDLPRLPEDFISLLLEDWQNQIPCNISPPVPCAGLPLYEKGETIGVNATQTNMKINSTVEEWVRKNITAEYRYVGVNITQQGYINASPHLDRRKFALIYLIRAGNEPGKKATLSFYQTKDQSSPEFRYFDYDQLEKIDSVAVPENTWYLVNGGEILHGNENISQGRFTFQITLDSIPENFKFLS